MDTYTHTHQRTQFYISLICVLAKECASAFDLHIFQVENALMHIFQHIAVLFPFSSPFIPFVSLSLWHYRESIFRSIRNQSTSNSYSCWLSCFGIYGGMFEWKTIAQCSQTKIAAILLVFFFRFFICESFFCISAVWHSHIEATTIAFAQLRTIRTAQLNFFAHPHAYCADTQSESHKQTTHYLYNLSIKIQS